MERSPMPVLRVLPLKTEIELAAGESRDLLELLSGAGITVESECGGEGTCGRCLVELVEGRLLDRKGDPAAPEHGDEYLACRSIPDGDCVIRVSETGEDRSLLDALVAGSIGVIPAARGAVGRLGVALDIGTTTVVALLADLDRKAPLAVESETNPQRAYGADVVSRIAFSTARSNGREGTTVLREAVVGCVNRLVGLLCERAGQDRDRIESVVCAGNTAMQHFLLGVTPAHLGMAPYEAEFKEAEPRPAVDIGLELSARARLEVLPNIRSFVGADTVACLLAVEEKRVRGFTLMVDMGTNTEMVLGRGDDRVACSAAAGPAFEGAHIRHGMRATPGAINSVRIEGGELVFGTVGGKPPVGICGSGIVDAVAALRRIGVVETSGRMRDCEEYVLVEAASSGNGRDITITRKDIREIQLVKASIATGMMFLQERFGIERGLLSRLFIAGAFGNYLDVENARYIGLLPDLPAGRFEPIGDAALKGACLCLIEGAPALMRAREIAYGTEHLELATRPEFQKRFIANLDLEA